MRRSSWALRTSPSASSPSPRRANLDKAGVAPKKYLREFDLENASELNVGDIVKADTFKEGDFVDVTGISKGHGYQGVIKRHGAHRLKETHGSTRASSSATVPTA